MPSEDFNRIFIVNSNKNYISLFILSFANRLETACSVLLALDK
ncbi:hypothetical protein NEILACOT_04044 [Neisseria lactamica ATCC 23970]|uniref:Uncharacterized protein n=1 Tax=Neisseria lactamica ATCC 23970 TaxID=546265 RepID=D0W939_NEILA|nr:hypothetical protein NEILACOT_04044 [Neisseria lactamica ATCC 23970]